ncbi:MAG: hypothetical protein R3D63_09455 [Paracoccaceae bacterium]
MGRSSTTTVAPTHSEAQDSYSEQSAATVAACSTTSSARICPAGWSKPSRVIARCGITTPFGLPVDPEV